ncbi:MAG TPA: cytochrome c [Steroidobacteraceae bacterium]|jgi:cytochrome c553
MIQFVLLLALLLGSSALAAGPSNPATAGPLLSPLSILEIMRAAIEIPADGLWAAQGNDKWSEDDWLLADQDAVQLIGATTLVSRGGTGKHDHEWTAKTDWQAWMRDMLKTAVTLRAAAKAQDAAKLSASADHLQEICSACHAKYRPAEPSDGVARYPFYPKRELAK